VQKLLFANVVRVGAMAGDVGAIIVVPIFVAIAIIWTVTRVKQIAM
jgi:hypothetical protein